MGITDSMNWLTRLASGFRPSAKAPVETTRGDLVAGDAVRASVHNQGLALLDLSTGKVFLCNQTGSLIWQGIVAGVSPDAICDEISREFGVAVDLVRRQTTEFVAELERRRLLTRRLECET